MTREGKMFKSGFVTVIGRPNVGKSTLLNKVMREKLNIVSDKPQTTRNELRLIHTEDDYQIIFVDTPGIQKPKNKLGEYMLEVSEGAMDGVDLIVFMVDESLTIGPMDRKILDLLKKEDTPKILVINKIDKLSEEELDGLKKKFEDMDVFSDIVAISAEEDKNIQGFLDSVKNLLPEGPLYYPEDQLTDRPVRFIVSEMIREKALLNLREELPHGISVKVESMKEREDRKLIDIEAIIYVERENHKGMVIGKGGKMLKKIGKNAREDIERFLDSQINLQLLVKTEKDWRDKESKLKDFGYE